VGVGGGILPAQSCRQCSGVQGGQLVPMILKAQADMRLPGNKNCLRLLRGSRGRHGLGNLVWL
jgi:hypothetical protein